MNSLENRIKNRLIDYLDSQKVELEESLKELKTNQPNRYYTQILFGRHIIHKGHKWRYQQELTEGRIRNLEILRLIVENLEFVKKDELKDYFNEYGVYVYKTKVEYTEKLFEEPEDKLIKIMFNEILRAMTKQEKYVRKNYDRTINNEVKRLIYFTGLECAEEILKPSEILTDRKISNFLLSKFNKNAMVQRYHEDKDDGILNYFVLKGNSLRGVGSGASRLGYYYNLEYIIKYMGSNEIVSVKLQRG